MAKGHEVVAIHTLVAGGKPRPPGETVAIPTKEEAQKLVTQGAAAWPADAPGAAPEETKDPVSDLPEGFPFRAELAAAGVTSVAGLLEVEDLTSLDGIGKARAEQISEALQELGQDGEEEGEAEDAPKPGEPGIDGVVT
jgi:hypothetical protein